MSRAMDYAEGMAAHLRVAVPWCSAAAAEADRVEVIVDRKLKIQSIVTQVVAKARGAAVVILFGGGTNADRASKRLRSGGEFSVFVMTRPLFADEIVTCDDLAEAVVDALHGWTPAAGSANEPRERVEVLEWPLVPDPRMVIYEVACEVKRMSGAESVAPVLTWGQMGGPWGTLE